MPRSKQFPPLPDLRFEQSYLASIRDASSWHMVAYITFRDQLFMPLTQGLLWTLLVAGWKNWNTVHNTTSNFSGSTIGARLRRWWWQTNNWAIPNSRSTLRDPKLAAQVQEVSTTLQALLFFHAEPRRKLMLTTLKYYQAEFSAGAD
jgi:hypothetical protein